MDSESHACLQPLSLSLSHEGRGDQPFGSPPANGNSPYDKGAHSSRLCSRMTSLQKFTSAQWPPAPQWSPLSLHGRGLGRGWSGGTVRVARLLAAPSP